MINKETVLKHLDKIVSTPEEKVVGLEIIDLIYNSIVPVDTADEKDPWAWVKDEYVPMFKAKNPAKGGKVRESTTRMKKMFAANPEIRKEDVILTVKLYLSQTDSRYIRYPHYFLKKGQGADAIYEFDDWYQKYLESKVSGKGRSNVINTMQ